MRILIAVFLFIVVLCYTNAQNITVTDHCKWEQQNVVISSRSRIPLPTRVFRNIVFTAPAPTTIRSLRLILNINATDAGNTQFNNPGGAVVLVLLTVQQSGELPTAGAFAPLVVDDSQQQSDPVISTTPIFKYPKSVLMGDMHQLVWPHGDSAARVDWCNKYQPELWKGLYLNEGDQVVLYVAHQYENPNYFGTGIDLTGLFGYSLEFP